MKKQLLLIAAAALGGTMTAVAQQDNFLLFSSQHELASSSILPSQLGSGNSTLWVNLPSVHAWAGTDFLKRGEAREILDGGQIPSELVDQVVNRLDGHNSIFAGAEVNPFAVGYTARKGGVEMVSVQLSWTEQAAVQAVVGEYLPKVAWFGNQPYAGTQLDLGPIEGAGIYQRKIAIGAAFPLLAKDNLSLRSGFRVHYNMGMAAAFIKPTQAQLFTAIDGSTIDYDLLVKAQLAGVNDFDPFNSIGRGVGIDFSTSVAWGGKFSADAGVSDLGYMRFYDKVETELIEGEEVFSGFQVTDVVNPFDGLSADTLNSFFNTESTSGGTFGMPMSSRLTFRFGYHVPQLDRRGRLYNQHSVYVVYAQGLTDGAMSSVVPGLTAAYVFSLNNILEVGSTLGYVQNGIDMGAFFSVRGGAFRFGMGSTDFSGLLFNGAHASADVSMRMSLAF